MKKLLMTALIALFVFGITTTAKAVVLTPGGASQLSTGAAMPSGVFLTQLVVPNFVGLDGQGQTRFTGTLTQDVYKNGTGILFAYQFHLNTPGTAAVHRMTIGDFNGFTTDVDVLTAGWRMGSDVYGSIGFEHPDVTGGEIDPGETSPWFWVQTNAGWYRDGSTVLQDGGNARMLTYGPIPEPTSMLLLGMGVLGLFGLKRKRA